MKKKEIAILLSVLSLIPVFITVFKDFLDIQEKYSDTALIVKIDQIPLDGYLPINIDNRKVYPLGVKNKIILSHNHSGKDSILIQSIDIFYRKITKNILCDNIPNTNNIKGSGTVRPIIFRSTILDNGKIITKIMLEDNSIGITESINILNSKVNYFIKLSDSDDDLEVINSYITIKNKGLHEVYYRIQFTIGNKNHEIKLKRLFLCY